MILVNILLPKDLDPVFFMDPDGRKVPDPQHCSLGGRGPEYRGAGRQCTSHGVSGPSHQQGSSPPLLTSDESKRTILKQGCIKLLLGEEIQVVKKGRKYRGCGEE